MPADVTMELDTRQASAFVRAVWADQLPFATSKAINDSAKGGQVVQRAHQRAIFEVRRPDFVDKAVKISKFANKKQDVPEARMRVEPPGGRKRADVIDKFETDRTKRARFSKSLAVPTRHVPRTAGGIIRKGWRPKDVVGKEFRLRGLAFRGVVVRGPDGRGTIFAAEEGGRQIAALYQLVPEVSIEPELHFVDNIRRHVLDNWDANFNRAFTAAMQTAR